MTGFLQKPVTGPDASNIAIRVCRYLSPLGEISVSRSSDHRRMPMHVHDRAHIAAVLEGRFDETDLPGSRRMLTVGDSVFYPARHGHEVVFGDGTTVVASVALTSRMVTDYGLASCTQVIVRTGLADDLLAIGPAFCGGGPVTGQALVGLFQAFDRIICRLAVHDESASWLDEVRSYLDAHLDAPPSLATLSRLWSKHPGYVSQAFRARFGVPISRYLRRQRLLAASSEFLAMGCTVTEAAHSAGFADSSHFARSFKAASSCSAISVRNSDAEVSHVMLPAA